MNRWAVTVIAALVGACGSVDTDANPTAPSDSSTPPDASALADSSTPSDAESDAQVEADADAGPLVCLAGFSDCDGAPDNGCEAELAADAMNCGACGYSCPAPANALATCAAGLCAASICKVGFFDCDGDPTTGCEVELAFDAKHCGTCGNDCGNVPCWNSGCLPEPEVVIDESLFGGAYDIEIAGPNIYWSNGTGVHMRAKQGGPITQLSSVSAESLAHDGQSIYFMDSYLYSVPISGSDVVQLGITGQTYNLAVEDGWVFWFYDPGGLKRIPTTGGTASTITSNKVYSIDTHGGYVYWSAEGPGVARQPIAGGPSTLVAQPSHQVGSVRANHDWVVFMEIWYELNDYVGELRKAPASGGPSQHLGESGYVDYDLLLVDDDYAFYPGSLLSRVSLSKSDTPHVLANYYPRAMAMDASYVYFAPTNVGTLFRVPKDP